MSKAAPRNLPLGTLRNDWIVGGVLGRACKALLKSNRTQMAMLGRVAFSSL